MGLLHHLCLCAIMACVFAQNGDKRHPPHITKYETKTHFELTPDSERTFVCEAEGIPKPTSKWVQTESFYKGTLLPDKLSEKGILFPQQFSQRMAGEYQCEASNRFGTVVTNHITLRLARNAKFDEDLVSTETGKVGGPAKLKCNMKTPSLPAPAYSWKTQKQAMKDRAANPEDQLIFPDWRRSVAPDGSLYFASLLKEDMLVKADGSQWYYMCVASNSVFGGSAWGGDTKLNVQDVPGQPATKAPSLPDGIDSVQTVNVLLGENLELFCFFNGYPEITYTWQKDGGLPSKELKYSNTRLTVKDVQNNDLYSGQYKCTGSLAVTKTQPTTYPAQTIVFNVNVQVPPFFKKSEKAVRNINTINGESFEMECEADGNPKPKIEWRVNNKKVDLANPGKRVKVTINKNGLSGTYSMTDVQKGSATVATDLRVISCYAWNDVGERYANGYLNVFTPMEFVQKPKDVKIVTQKEVIKLKCAVKSDPSRAPTITWFRNDIKLIVDNNDKVKKRADNTLEIFPEAYENGVKDIIGTYKCQADITNPNLSINATAEVTADPDTEYIPITTAGGGNLWWIAIVVAIILIIIILLLIFCCIKRNKGESYPVDENERKTGNDPVKDLRTAEHGGFTDYQRSEKDPIGGSRASLDGSIKPLDSDDDADSMAEYGDIDTGKFNEDGSFIGQYLPPDKNKNTQAPPPYSTSGGDSMV